MICLTAWASDGVADRTGLRCTVGRGTAAEAQATAAPLLTISCHLSALLGG